MNSSSLILGFIALINLVLASLIFARNRKKKENIYFFTMLIGIVLWSISLLLYNLKLENQIYLWGQAAYFFSAITICSFLLFVIVFPEGKKINQFIKIFLAIVYSIYILPTLIPFSVFSEINIYDGHIITIFNWDYYLHSILTLILFLSGFIILIIKYKKSRGSYKSQLLYITAGTTISTIIAIYADVILFSQTSEYNWLGPAATLFLVIFTTFAIVKHRLMDIRMVVARSVAYAVLLITLAGIYAGSVLGLEKIFFPEAAANFSLAQGAMRTTISVVMVFLFQPLKKWITEATDKIFFKNQYNSEELLSDLSHTIGSTIVLIEMLYKVNALLVDKMKLSRSAFVLFKNEDTAYTSQAVGYKGWPPVNVPDFRHMVKKGILIYDELEDNSTYKKMLHKYDASVMMPIIADRELIGVFLAGEKSSGDMFNQQDIQVLEIMGPEVAVGIENAKSYEEISKFNVTLRQEIKRATQRLKLKNEQLKELDKAKDEFISMASHQLRTPLTAIKGYLSMLLEGDAGEIKVSQYDFINEAYSAAGRMVGLINDLLNVSRMETGRFFLEPKEVDIERIVSEEVKQLENHAREKGLYLKIEKKGKVPKINADETKIRQVVMNFIDNALYYTQKGGVTVKLRKDKDDFIFEVVDTGIGVPKAQQAHLFEKFFRADNARQTRPDGTGLGIYLAKRVTEDHGGKVIFQSEEGKGSTFGFKFPLHKRVSSTGASTTPAVNHLEHSAPALTSAAATFNEKTVGLETPVGSANNSQEK